MHKKSLRSNSASRKSQTVNFGEVSALRKDSISHTEAQTIRQKLDALSGTQNPLLGVDFDDEDSRHLRGLGPVPEKQNAKTEAIRRAGSAGSIFVRKMTIHHKLDDVFSTPNSEKPSSSSTTTFSLENSVVELPPAAACWYPPSMWGKRVLDVKGDTFLPLEFDYRTSDSDRAEIVRQELELINLNLSRLEARIRQIVWEMEEQPDNQDNYEKEMRKQHEEMRAWELKQWKAQATLDREATVFKKDVIEKDIDGNLVKTYIIKDGQQTITGATKEAFVSLLLDETNADVTFTDIFLLSYVLIIQPKELLESLTQKYQRSDVKTAFSLRFVSVLKKWVDIAWFNDIQLEGLEAPFRELSNNVLQSLKESGHTANLVDFDFLASYISNRRAQYTNSNNLKRASTSHLSQLVDSVGDNPLFLKMFDETKALATTLALKELRLYSEIPVRELLDKLVTTNTDHQSPKLVHTNAFINWVNQIGYWVGTEICMTSDLKKRIKKLTKFIELAKECVNLGCYNTMFAIVTGLGGSSIARLQKTWQGLNKKTMALFQELEKICSPGFNYKEYREIEKSSQPPFIPFLAMHLRDMVFMNDGNPSKLPNGLYNFSKIRSLCLRAQSVLSYQNKTFYSPPKDKNDGMTEYVDTIGMVKPLQERHLYRLSCMCEPPAWRKRSIFVASRTSDS